MRCPLHSDMSNELSFCDSECAWLMKIKDASQFKACAAAICVLGKKSRFGTWEPANIVNEYEELGFDAKA